MRNARILTLAAALIALAMMIAAGPGTRYGYWNYQAGLSMLAWATYAGIGAALVSVILIALLAVKRWRSQAWMPMTAFVIALATIGPPVALLFKAKAVPPIHDITTDTADPPAFVALMTERIAAPNGAAYGGAAIAKQQEAAYPDIKPLETKDSLPVATQRAADIGRGMGWEIVATDPAAGRVEATATTGWFGFKDDIVVRVRAQAGGGSLVDVRSVSRVGRSDIGANAARIREFLAHLA
jgi:uncharacterized protein (DUF1499 family)